MDPNEPFILHKLRQLARLNPRNEAAERALARAKSQLSAIPAEPVKPSSASLRKKPWFRSKPMISRIATLVIGGAAVIAVVLALNIHDGSGQIAFAQVIDKVQQTQSLTFKVKIKGEGGKEEEQRIIILPEGKMRTEGSYGYAVQDNQNHKMIMVNKNSKTAMIVEGFAPPFPEMAKLNPYEMIRNIVRKNNPQRLPDEEIDGRKTNVFMVEYKMPSTEEKVPCKVWVDSKTELPLRIEMTMEETPGKKTKVLMYDMVFDQRVDPSLFSFAPPAGYTVQTTGTAHLPELPKKSELKAPEIIPGVGLGPVRFGMSREEIEKHFGKPDRYENNKTTLIYHSRGFVLYVNPRRGLINIHCMSQTMNLFKVREFAGKTKEGIGIGSSLQDLEKVFGKPERDEGHDPMNKRLIYTKRGLDIDLFQDKVIGILMRNIRSSP
jgi:outer membrane lipoprotein-sorting protein